MILLLALGVAFAVGILRGGRLIRLVSLPLRWPALPALAFAAQIVVIYFPAPPGSGLLSLHAAVLVLSYMGLLLAVWINRRIPGMVLLGLGLLLNLVVMVANGGYMPITPENMQRIGHRDALEVEPRTRVARSKDIALPREQTQLWPLSDVFVLPPPFPIPSAFSPGDVLIAAGAFLVVQRALLGRPLQKGTSSNGGDHVPTRTGPPGRHRLGRVSLLRCPPRHSSSRSAQSLRPDGGGADCAPEHRGAHPAEFRRGTVPLDEREEWHGADSI